MDRDRVLSKLREHEAELRAAGIMTLSLFGSVARGDASDESDVDLMVDFDRAKRLSLLGAVGLENKLSDILGLKADLSQREMLKPDVLQRATREAVRVF
jgi:predicted nucleotidyltransferase